MATAWRLVLAAVCLLFLGAGAAQSDGRPRFLIRYANAPNAADEARVRAFGGEVIHRYQIVPALAAQVPAGVVAALSRSTASAWSTRRRRSVPAQLRHPRAAAHSAWRLRQTKPPMPTGSGYSLR